jgi:hypothetical protein
MESGITVSRRKTCSECGSRIVKGGYFFQVQPATRGEGSRSLCEACTSLLSMTIASDIRSSRIFSGHSLAPCKCLRCARRVDSGEALGKVRVRPWTTVTKDGMTTQKTRFRFVCKSCIEEVRLELKVFRIGFALAVGTENAVRYLSGPAGYLRDEAERCLE